jgi:hypothetical protein
MVARRGIAIPRSVLNLWSRKIEKERRDGDEKNEELKAMGRMKKAHF